MSSIQRYRIIQKIDAGGMAAVFLARDQVLGRDVALKMLHPHLLNQKKSLARFANEAEAIASLSHENIIRIFDYGENQSRPFLVMEFIDGPTLLGVLEEYGPLPDLVCLEIARQVLSGLSCAHGSGIYHRDIKPANIMIHRDNNVKIMDFGLAFLVNKDSITMTGSLLGSPRYVAPEQVEGKPLTAAADIWSFGVLLYQCVTGRVPFDGETPHAIISAIVNMEAESPRIHKSDVVFLLAELIEKCLVKETEKRPGSEELLRFIQKRCEEEKIGLYRERISEFFKDPQKYQKEERAELFQVFRQGALDQIQRKNLPSALRKLEQARFFGDLSENDRKLLARLNRKGKTRPVLVAAAVALLFVLVSFFWIFKSTVQTEKNIAKQEVAVPIRSDEGPVSARTSLPEKEDHDAATEQNAEPPVKQVPLVIRKENRTEEEQKPKEEKTVEENGTSGPGFLDIRSNPPWAKIVIDGLERGVTPRTRNIALSPGEHQFELKKAGFTDYREKVVIKSCDTLELRIKMTSADFYDSGGSQQ